VRFVGWALAHAVILPIITTIKAQQMIFFLSQKKCIVFMIKIRKRAEAVEVLMSIKRYKIF